MTSIKSDIFKSNRASFGKLNNDNYPQLADPMSRTLKAEELCEITMGEETCSVDADAEAIKKHRNRQQEAGALLHNACSVYIGLFTHRQLQWECSRKHHKEQQP
jgi:hypothetical protein